jgi:hypothetical protein
MPKQMHEKTKRALELIGTVREVRPVYWTISAAARECGVSTQTLHRHLRRRKPDGAVLSDRDVNLPQAPGNQAHVTQAPGNQSPES